MISNIDGIEIVEDDTELLPLEHSKSEVYIHFPAMNNIYCAIIVLLFSLCLLIGSFITCAHLALLSESITLETRLKTIVHRMMAAHRKFETFNKSVESWSS